MAGNDFDGRSMRVRDRVVQGVQYGKNKHTQDEDPASLTQRGTFAR